MKDILLSKRYAKALFGIALDNNETDAVRHDLDMIAAVLADNHELRTVIANPFVSNQHKNAIFNGIFQNHISDTTKGFLSVLLEKNREDQIQFIAEQYTELYNAHNNIVIVTVTTAIPIDDNTLERIASKMADKTDRNIKAVNVIDESIIGGFIINMDDYQYDASVSNAIHKLYMSFDKNLFIKGY